MRVWEKVKPSSTKILKNKIYLPEEEKSLGEGEAFFHINN